MTLAESEIYHNWAPEDFILFAKQLCFTTLFKKCCLSGRAGVSMNLEIKFASLDHELMDTLI